MRSVNGREVVPREPVREWVLAAYRRGWTQTALAEASGVSDRQLREIVSGKLRQDGRGNTGSGKHVHLDTADRLACVLGHHLSELDDAA